MLTRRTDGVLSTLSTTTQTTSDSLSSAFTDLEALMTQAGAMVKLAGDLSAKLASVEAAAAAIPGGTASAAQPEDAAFIRSSLAQLGMTLPGGAAVATAADGDERAWHVQLARELATVLQGSTDPRAPSHGKGIMTDRGVLTLDEVWGAWNRARGVALLPPGTLLAVLPLIPGATNPPVHARTFDSGLRVLHTPDLAPGAFATRAAAAAPRTAVETARAERLAVGLAAEMLAEAEQAGELVRDDPRTAGTGAQASAGQVRWWANEWRGYIWDGQEDGDAAL
jgi:ESCRT-II complex subunit VPS36